jgi:hypothetical protein
MRVDQTSLVASLGDPKVSWGKSTGLLEVPTLVWPIPQTGMHITIFPDEVWKSAEMGRQTDLTNRRNATLAQDDENTDALVAAWRNEGRSDEEIEVLLDNTPMDFDTTLETPPLDVASVTFDQWHLTDQTGSAWFSLTGQLVNYDSQAALAYARHAATYFAQIGLPVAL